MTLRRLKTAMKAAPTYAAFTLVEMLVVLLIITILIGIGLAVGTQVESSSEMNLTKTELKNLQAALNWYIHKSGGQVPANMGQFLQDYQLDHATPGPNDTWKQTPDVLTAMPSNLVVAGTFLGPGGSGSMTGVICVLDGFGNPIQYMPPAPNPPTLYANPAIPSDGDSNVTTWLDGGTYASQNLAALPSVIVNQHTFQYGTGSGGNTTGWYPTTGAAGSTTPNYSHTPYFFSFGPLFSAAQANNGATSTFGPSDYIYSYNQ
jgi:prepilin-type N-terminal cleavage/methylation domain-containing protein